MTCLDHPLINETRRIESVILTQVTSPLWTRMLLDNDIKLNLVLSILFNIEDNFEDDRD
jgi:hypothetical protein